MGKQENMTFEDAIKNLEKIVSMLEEENVPLEDAIKLYQDGMALTEKCQKKLESAEKKMVKIVENNEIKDFEVGEAEEDDA